MNVIEEINKYESLTKDRYINALKLEKFTETELKVYRLGDSLKDEIKRTLTTVAKGFYSDQIHLNEETGTYSMDDDSYSYLLNEKILKEKYPTIYNYSLEFKAACKELKDNLASRKEVIEEVLENYCNSLTKQLADELNLDINEIDEYGNLKNKENIKNKKLKELSQKIYNARVLLTKCKSKNLEEYAPHYENGKFIENKEIRSLFNEVKGYLYVDMNDYYNLLKRTQGETLTKQFFLKLANELNTSKQQLAIRMGMMSNTFDNIAIPTKTYHFKEKKEKPVKDKVKKEKKSHKKIELSKVKHILLIILSIIFFPVTLIYLLIRQTRKLDTELDGNITSAIICLISAIALLVINYFLLKFNLLENFSYSIIKFGENCANKFFDQESWGTTAGNFILQYTNDNFFLLIILALPALIAMLLGVIARIICAIFVLLFVLILVVLGMFVAMIPDLIPILIIIGSLIIYFIRGKSVTSLLITLITVALSIGFYFII